MKLLVFALLTTISLSVQAFDLREWIAQNHYANNTGGSCQKHLTEHYDPQIAACLWQTGNCNTTPSQFRNHFDIQEKVFFDLATQQQVEEQNCEAKNLQLIDLKSSSKIQAIKAQRLLLEDMATKIEDIRLLRSEKQKRLTHFYNKNPRCVTTAMESGIPCDIPVQLTSDLDKIETLIRASLENGHGSKQFIQKFIDHSIDAKNFSTAQFLKNAADPNHPDSFQQLVVEAQKKELLEDRQELKKMNGKYTYAYKSRLIKAGIADRLILKADPSSAVFNDVACVLEGKYRGGKEIAVANAQVVAGAASAVFTGGAGALIWAGRLGLVAMRSAQVASAVAGVLDAGVSVAAGYVSDCQGKSLKTVRQAICQENTSAVATEPLMIQEVEEGNCVLSLGLSALGGVASGFQLKQLKSFKNSTAQVTKVERASGEVATKLDRAEEVTQKIPIANDSDRPTDIIIPVKSSDVYHPPAVNKEVPKQYARLPSPHLDEVLNKTVTLEEIVGGHNHKVYLIKDKNAKSVGIFKPVDGEDRAILKVMTYPDPPTYGLIANREVAASVIDQKLKLGRVPRARFATVNGKRGVLMDFVEGQNLDEVKKNPELLTLVRKSQSEGSRQESLILDFLTGNTDRLNNPANTMIALKDGKPVGKPWLIDNGGAFGPTDAIRPGKNPDKKFVLPENLPKNFDGLENKKILNELRRTSAEEWSKALSPYLDKADIDGFLRRRQLLLERYFPPASSTSTAVKSTTALVPPVQGVPVAPVTRDFVSPTIVYNDKVQAQLNPKSKFNPDIRKKAEQWIESVQTKGREKTMEIPGYHDEPLYEKKWNGHRSVRLNGRYRLIYKIEPDGTINVREISNQPYRH